MNSPYTTRTTVNPDALAAYTSAVLLARHANRADNAKPVAPTTHMGPRTCPCGVALEKFRKFCDPCRDESRRRYEDERAERRRAYRARKKAA